MSRIGGEHDWESWGTGHITDTNDPCDRCGNILSNEEMGETDTCYDCLRAEEYEKEEMDESILLSGVKGRLRKMAGIPENNNINESTWLGVSNVKKAPPTRRHRPAIWEVMLGTVMAMNDRNETKYFDYDHEGAKEWAGVDSKSDIRIYPYKDKFRRQWSKSGDNPRKNQYVLWVEKAAKVSEGRQQIVRMITPYADADMSGRELLMLIKDAFNDLDMEFNANMANEVLMDLGRQPIAEDSDPCWNGYEMIGMKDKNGKEVPNCVPEGVEEYTIECATEVFGPFVEENLSEAEYQGRKVTLNKPTRGDVKKFKVYVKNDKGNVVKVNFGDPDMRIKKSNPERRKSFRARHNCDNPGPKWKARYWSCRKW